MPAPLPWRSGVGLKARRGPGQLRCVGSIEDAAHRHLQNRFGDLALPPFPLSLERSRDGLKEGLDSREV